MKSKVIYAVILCLMLGFQFVKGQSSQPSIEKNYAPSPLTPEAAALAKMVNYPVNHNTGIPDIRIPLYEIKTGGMSLPIELTYHSGGFKINEQASRVGLGWSLSCDLQITRTINGGDDTKSLGYINISSNYLDITNSLNRYNIAMGINDGMPDRFYYKLMNKSGSFYFNRAGSIIPYPYDNIKIEYNNGVFTVTDTDGCKYYFGYFISQSVWSQVDSRSQCGTEISADSYSEHSTVNSRTMTWKCMKIENANNTESIEFNYSNSHPRTLKTYHDRIELWENKVYNPSAMGGPFSAENATWSINNNYPGSSINPFPPFYQLSSPKYMIYCGGPLGSVRLHLPYLNNQSTVADSSYAAQGSTVSSTAILGVKLKSIKYRGGKIDFNENNDSILASITVNDNQCSRTIAFSQSFTGTDDMIFAKRCNLGIYSNVPYMGTNYLDSVIIGDDRYAFRYYEKYCFGSHLIGSDFWGYCNGNTRVANNQRYESDLTIPRMKKPIARISSSIEGNPVSFGGLDIKLEQPSETYMRKGVLSHIIYPTGGITNFAFEANKYKDSFLYYHYDRNYEDGIARFDEIIEGEEKTIRTGGGLRIKSIAHYTGDGQTAASLKYYKYGEFEEGYGEVANKPVIKQNQGEPYYSEYSGFSFSQKIKYVDSAIYKDAIGLDIKTTYLPFSALDNTYANGSPVYYTSVTEYQTKMGGEAGKTVYKYYNRYELIDDILIEPIDPQGSMMEIGEDSELIRTNVPRLKVDWYLGALKSVTDYKYIGMNYKPVHTKTMEYMAWKPGIIAPSVVWAYPGTIYELIGEPTLNDPSYYDMVDCHAEEYTLTPGRLLLGKEKEDWIDDNNKQTTQITEYKYDNLNSLKIQPSRIIRQSSDGKTVTSRLKYSYDYNELNQMRDKNIISPVIEEIDSVSNAEISRTKVNYTVNNGRVLRSSIVSSSQGSPLTTDITFNQYDDFDNPVQATYRDGTIKTWVWGYNRRYMVAEVIGKTFAEVYAALNMNTINNPSSEDALKTQLNNLYNLSGSNVMVNAYTYKPLSGVSWHSSPGKIITRYEYDDYGRLMKIRGHNEEILNEYVYHNRRMPNMPLNTILPFTTLPTMETYSGLWLCAIYNYFRPGGEMSGYDKGDSFDVAEYNTEYANINCVPVDEDDVKWIEFLKDGVYSTGPKSPSNIQIYLFNNSDSSLVACMHMEARRENDNNSGYRDLFLPPGEYTIRWVMSGLDYDKPPITLKINDGTLSRQINSGDTINLNGTKWEYKITITEPNYFSFD